MIYTIYRGLEAAPTVPAITCTSHVKQQGGGVETIMVHDLAARRSSQRPNEHPTPGKIPKRPRAKSTVDSMINQVKIHIYLANC